MLIFRPNDVGLSSTYTEISVAPAWDDSALTLIAAMSVTPNAARQSVINKLVTDLKGYGVWSKLDELWVFAAATEQAALLGWKRLKDATKSGTPTFAADRGFTRTTGTQYINTNFVPSSDGVNYTQSDASYGLYNRTNSESAEVDMGVISSSQRCLLYSRRVGGATIAEINSSGTTNRIVGTNSNSQGFYVVRRSASNAIQLLKNGSQTDSNTEASTGLPGHSFYIPGYNNSGTQTSATVNRQYAAVFVGAAMTTTEQSNFYTAIQAYMTSVGANV